jgi:hypothetical protein
MMKKKNKSWKAYVRRTGRLALLVCLLQHNNPKVADRFLK